MNVENHRGLFDLVGKSVVVTGGAGRLCAYLCQVLATAGVKVAILDINLPAAEKLATEIGVPGGQAVAIECDACNKVSLQTAAQQIIGTFGNVDCLINGAGGNSPNATTSVELPFFDLPEEALNLVIDLNLMSTIYASQVFGQFMVAQKRGVILNISSMNAFRPLTRIPAYSAAKAAVSNFTQWLAAYMAREYSPEIRVNAIAPGFFLTDQNRFLLTDRITGELTERGRMVISHTPMQRFGCPEDLVGTVVWLLSNASAFVTGIIVPVDGGFSAFSGV